MFRMKNSSHGVEAKLLFPDRTARIARPWWVSVMYQVGPVFGKQYFDRSAKNVAKCGFLTVSRPSISGRQFAS